MTDDITTYRDRLATERGISDEDRDILLSGKDEQTLLAQANYLAPIPEPRRNIAPREGQAVSAPTGETTFAEFTQRLFNAPTDPLDF